MIMNTTLPLLPTILATLCNANNFSTGIYMYAKNCTLYVPLFSSSSLQRPPKDLQNTKATSTIIVPTTKCYRSATGKHTFSKTKRRARLGTGGKQRRTRSAKPGSFKTPLKRAGVHPALVEGHALLEGQLLGVQQVICGNHVHTHTHPHTR